MIRRKIIVIDDEPLIATLMKELVDEDPGLEISTITTNKEEFLDAVTQNPFDIALVDISVGGRGGGLEILRSLKDKGIKIPVIVLSAHDERLYAVQCLKAGARGYVSKEWICAQLVFGLKEVLNGELFVSGDKGRGILEQYKKINDASVNTFKTSL